MLDQKAFFLLFAFICLTINTKIFGQGENSASTFTLNNSARTSAGVYKPDGTLVRTLWSGVVKEAGTHQVKWDGTDDFMQPLPVDNYVIKVVSNNVQYNWQGTIGNNSASQLGPNIHRSLDPPNNIVIAGDNAYYTVGYDEMTASHFQFALNSPRVKLDPFSTIANQTTDYACTDGTNIYWTGWDNYQDAYSWVYATKVSDNSLVNFTAGVSYKVRYGKNFPSVIDFKSIQARPSGIAVSSDYLFVSYKSLGYISVLNKTSGAFVRNLNFTSPTSMAVDGSSIWISSGTNTLQKYPINSDGTLGNATLSISNLSSPVDVRVNGNTLAVVDGGTSQQVKTFNTSTGTAGWVLGQLGGVLNSPIVSNDRFGFWRIEEITSEKKNQGGIAFASDGSFWIVDASNRRMMHFDANRNFVEAVQYQSKTYTCYVDPNNHSRVIANLLEFEVNYSSPIQNSWTLKYNWEGSFKTEYHLADAVKDITTLSNGRTYGIVRRKNNIDNYEFVELLPSSGLRYTGVAPKGANALKLYPNGDVYDASYNGLGETQTWKKMTLTGFNGSNDPVYTALSTIVTNTTASDIKQPRLSGSKLLPWEVTSSNVLVCFRGNREEQPEENAYHLGGLNAATGQWIWKTSLSTRKDYQGEFPTDGAFDLGNGTTYQGNVAMAFERNIVWGFHGEGWKGSQVNKWNHYYDNGLFVGQFGFTGPEFNEDPIRAAGFAGNAFSPSIVKEGDDYYMYHNDESVHGGIHRWKITGLNTIQEQTIQITSSFVRTTEALEGIDLMAGLPNQGALSSNSQGWTRSPDVETNDWTAQTNLLTYGVRKSPDLSVTYNPTGTGVNTISRNLGNNSNLNNWGIVGNIGYNMSAPNSPDGLGLNQYLDVLDNSGKIIVRFYQKVNYSTNTTTIYANNTALFTSSIGEMRVLTKNFQPLDIDKIGSTITVTYAGQSAVIDGVYDAGANMSNPTTMRLYFSNVGGFLFEKFVRISDFRFVPFNTTVTPGAPTVTADFAAKTLSATSPLGNSEILVSENNGAFVQYTGSINVGNVARPTGYWQFKIKPAAERNVSAITKSPEFVESYECSATGTILHEVWYNVNGASISSNDWSRKPDNTTPITLFEAPRNFGDNFAARIRGYLCPPQTGYYTFWVSGDDATELWLSSDADPAHKTKIAYSGVTGARDWNLMGSQKSVQVFLKAGGKYYIEALHKEILGQDHIAVAWQLPNGSMEAPIPGSRLSPFAADANLLTASVAQPCSATGGITHEVWNNVTGSSIASNNWSNNPTNTTPLSLFEAPSNIGDNYAARIRGYICPPQSGNYTFWISGDDATELYLSTDADPANKSKIAYSGVTASRDWNLYGSQKSFQIYLKAGNKYYIEALHKEELGQDYMAVAWQLPDGKIEAPIPGTYLSPFDNQLIAKTLSVVTQTCSATGSISHEVWNNVTGSGVRSNNWSSSPNNVSPLTLFEAPRNIGDNYAARIRGYICAPQSGNYTFWISGDDATELWLSTDADPANKIKIAYSGVTTPRDWNLYSYQKSFQIYLVAGNKYYIEALHKEEYGQDNLSVAWQLPDGTVEAPVPGKYLSPFESDLNRVATSAIQTCSATGTISHEVWNNVVGYNINSNNWAKNADNARTLTSFESPSNIGDNYAARIRGYVCPPQSGNYTFWISGDDATELYLSSDADPANKSRIAYSTLFTAQRNWDRYGSQKSFQIYLRAGSKYYIEALHKEATGDDHLSVAWQLPDGTMEAPISGSHLSPFNSDNSTTLNARVVTGNAVNAIESLGASTASEVIANQGMSHELEWKIYPNPIIGNNISIQSGFIPKGDYNLLLVDGLGQTVFKKSVIHGGGPFSYSISLSTKLSKGSYILNISGKDVRFTKKLVK